ncbi:MAG TPA: M48 family metallopeptidase, partial [Candidatus Absconditabacterales bacterium]|nr:M48 family metallopeptidase [Candidatus Absconditabacterales bacterium]
MEIIYKPIKNGYARIDKEGKLLITIPVHKKGSEFEKIMIKKGEALFQRYHKRTHVEVIKKDSIILFGEEIPLEDFYKQYGKKKDKSSTGHLSAFTSKILKEILREYTTPLFDLYSKKLGIPYQKLSFRKTSSKRGSCTYDQKISLNLDLIHLPTKYIKYVVIHEACHLKIKNHSKRFRALVESLYPNYKETKKELRKFVIK